MFGSSVRGANAYTQVGLETSVSGASPHRLIVLLFDGAIASLSTAQFCMQNKDVAGKGSSINRAITIVDSGLRASLNVKVGGEVAQTLDNLYAYMSHRLLVANLQNDPAIVFEVMNMLKDIRESWAAINPDRAPLAHAAPAVMQSTSATGMYGKNLVAA